MLGLKFETSTSWVEVAKNGLEQVFTDHAFAEQKAASNAVSIIINYSEETELVRAMSDIAIEEMEHFKMIINKPTNFKVCTGIPYIYSLQIIKFNFHRGNGTQYFKISRKSP